MPTAGAGGRLHVDLHVHHVLHEVLRDALHHQAEHLVALALPLGERILLAHRPEVDALLEVVHLVEVLAPLRVDDLEHHLALDLAHHVGAELALALLVVRDGVVDEQLVEVVGALDAGELLLGERRSASR